MATLTPLPGAQALEIVDEATGDGGIALSDNFRKLITNIQTNTDPSNTDSSTNGYRIGSRWYNIASKKEYVLVAETASGYATWVSLSDFVPLSGGAMTGPLTSSGTLTLQGAAVKLGDGTNTLFQVSSHAGYVLIQMSGPSNDGFWFDKSILFSNDKAIGNANSGGSVYFANDGSVKLRDNGDSPVLTAAPGGITINKGLFFLPQYPSGSAPTGVTGGMYYNTSDNTVRVYNGSAWKIVTMT